MTRIITVLFVLSSVWSGQVLAQSRNARSSASAQTAQAQPAAPSATRAAPARRGPGPSAGRRRINRRSEGVSPESLWRARRLCTEGLVASNSSVRRAASSGCLWAPVSGYARRAHAAPPPHGHEPIAPAPLPLGGVRRRRRRPRRSIPPRAARW